jgi:carbamoyltransferase
MIVVGIGKAYHDCSICVYIDGHIKYAKYEREVGIKHARSPEQWFYKKLFQWGVDFDKINFIIETDGGYYNGSIKSNKLPHGGVNFYTKHKKYHTTKHYVIDHHLAHAWSNSQFTKNSQAMIIDGLGSGDHTCMIYSDGKIQRTNSYSPGTTLNALGRLIGLSFDESIDNAGKVMGLVPYGKPNLSVFDSLKTVVPKSLPTILSKIKLSNIFNKETIDSNPNLWDETLTNVATINELCYKVVLDYAKQLDKSKPIIYSGGCALNVDWNRRLFDDGYNLIIEPHVYDGGISVGCMRFGISLLDEEITSEIKNFPYIQDDIPPEEIPTEETITKIAEYLSEGKIVGWYQGNGEIGPRALGNRSILMDPTIADGKDILNNKVKHREWFRPFGASVKRDKAAEYFDLEENPYMLFTSKVLDDRLKSVTHVDGTCRHQTVTPEQNALFYSLLDKFQQITGIPVLLNTSLNLGGKPIAGNPADAIELFNTTEMDVLCIGNTIYIK